MTMHIYRYGGGKRVSICQPCHNGDHARCEENDNLEGWNGMDLSDAPDIACYCTDGHWPEAPEPAAPETDRGSEVRVGDLGTLRRNADGSWSAHRRGWTIGTAPTWTDAHALLTSYQDPRDAPLDREAVVTSSPTTPQPDATGPIGIAALPVGTTRADVIAALHTETVMGARRCTDWGDKSAAALGHLVGIARCTTDRAALDSAVTVALLCITPEDTLAQLDAVTA